MKRNRAATEQKILAAAVALIVEGGFDGFGINAVAQRAGVDKVLIYRYFEDLDGLLSTIVDHYALYPDPTTLPNSSFELFLRAWRRACRDHDLGLVLARWADAVRNPLTDAFLQARKAFWAEATRQLQPASEASVALLQLCASLPTEAPLDPILQLAGDLAFAATDSTSRPPEATFSDDQLPTNLL